MKDCIRNTYGWYEMIIDWKTIKPDNFEKLVRDLLDQIGLQEVINIGRAGDENLDILAKETYQSKRGYTITKNVMVQVKRYLARKMNPSEFFNIINDAKNQNIDHLVIVNLSGFTSGVKDRYLTYTNKRNKPTIELWEKNQIESYIFRFPHLLRYFSAKLDKIDSNTKESILKELKKRWSELSKAWLNGGSLDLYKEKFYNPDLYLIIKGLISLTKDFEIIKEYNFYEKYYLSVLNRSIYPEISHLGSPILFYITTYNPTILCQSYFLKNQMFPELEMFMEKINFEIAFTLQTVDIEDRIEYHKFLSIIGKNGIMLDYNDIDSIVKTGNLNSIIIQYL